MHALDLPTRRPGTIAALAADIAQAAHQGHRIRLEGSNSSPRATFRAADRPIQTLSTLKLAKILDHAVGDMTVTVQAGITLEALQRQLAWRNQWLPVDPPLSGTAPGAKNPRTPGSRTIGGLIASNALGPLRFGSGDWRLFILGMRWVDARGTIIKGGGKTVKNVAGYSTPRLMIGTHGCFGAIAEVTLRTFARPVDEQSALFFCESPSAAEDLLAKVFTSPTSPAYVQVIGARTFSANTLQLPAPAAGGLVVAVGYLGREDICSAQIDTVRTLATQAETITLGAAQSGRLRLWMTTDAGGARLGFRLFARSSQVAALVREIEAAASASAWVVSEAGNGVIRGSVELSGRPAIEMLAYKAQAEIVWLGTAEGKNAASPGTGLADRLKDAIDPGHVFADV